jgi:uncharacterized protein (AIM24 family)
MFCTSCGAQVQDGAAFCVGCGTRVKRSDPPPVATIIQEAPTPSPQPPPRSRQATCEWCGAIVDASQSSCPRCGATLNAKAITTESGWAKLPGRKDMAKLQFGDSFCQVEGAVVPVADMNLAAADSVYFAHHVLLWKDPQINITTMSLAGAWKRMFAGLPIVMTQAQGPGHIAFSRDAPGELVALPIQPGQAVDVREHLFMVATGNVAYDWFNTNIWFSTRSGDENETHYPVGMFMDRFTAPQSAGLLLLHAAGNVFVRELSANQTILVKPTALIFKDPSVTMQLHFEQPRTGFSMWGSWGNRYMWLRLFGPGRVAVQSVFEPLEGDNRSISSCSSATQRQW